jgi:predicted permease
VLVYARTVTRTSEIVVRTALGASRARIATQLFVEALVLCSASALVGLVAAGWLLQRVSTFGAGGSDSPFWREFALTPSTVAWAFGFAAVASVVVGVLPALGATGRRLRERLQTATGGGSGPVLGRTWTVLIVLEVAVAVAVLPAAINAGGQLIYSSRSAPTFATDEVLWASPELEPEVFGGADGASAAGASARNRETQSTLLSRLAAEPWVSDLVTMRPAPWQDPDLATEIEGAASTRVDDPNKASLPTGVTAGWSRVSPNFFDAFGVSVTDGRAFADAEAARIDPVVVVSQMFVDRFLGRGNPLGVRVRPARRDGGTWDLGTGGEWYTIIGVVPDMNRAVSPLAVEPKVYQPLPPVEHDRMSFAVRVRGGDPASRIERLRAIALEVDPLLQLEGLTSVREMYQRGEDGARILTLGLAAVALSVLLLSVAGLYALMSFTVARRHREIGIRVALGARSYPILRGVLARAARQVAVGIAIGLALASLFDKVMGGLTLSGRGALIFPGVALLMAAVGVLAAWGPARRGLRIQPTEALRAD